MFRDSKKKQSNQPATPQAVKAKALAANSSKFNAYLQAVAAQLQSGERLGVHGEDGKVIKMCFI